MLLNVDEGVGLFWGGKSTMWVAQGSRCRTRDGHRTPRDFFFTSGATMLNFVRIHVGMERLDVIDVMVDTIWWCHCTDVARSTARNRILEDF